MQEKQLGFSFRPTCNRHMFTAALTVVEKSVDQETEGGGQRIL